ncbi:hypothetical protein DUNSADRAFT_10028 [Dunaliella salina]|nr:hypothetical protein DUNSADRAFT_10028 [Dunaliella salina]|eukprot:KAF5833613.1 hypothetical protein DUNSADRAFT_10028 [Dunaliella salina]
MASPTHSSPNATPILPPPPRPVAAAAAAPHDSADGKLGSGMGPSVSQTIHGEPRATAPGTDGHSGIGRGGVGSIDGIHRSGLGTRGEQGGLGSDTMGIGPCGVFSAGAAAKGILGSSSNVGEDELRAVIGKDGAGDSMPAASTIFDASQFGTAGATCGSAAAAAAATSDKLPSVTCSSVMPLLHPHNTNPINTLGMGKGTSSNVPPIPPPSTTANPFPGALFPTAQPLHLTGTSIIPPFPFHIPTTISALTPPASHALQQFHPQHAHHPAPKKAAAAPPVSAMFSNASSSPLSSTPSSSAAAAAAAPAAPLATVHLASSSSSSNSTAQQQHQLQSMLPPPHSLLNELLGLGVTSHSSSDLQQQQHMCAPQSLLNSVLGGAITKSGGASLPQLPNHLPYSLLQPKDPHVPSGLQTPIYTTPREQTGSETL